MTKILKIYRFGKCGKDATFCVKANQVTAKESFNIII